MANRPGCAGNVQSGHGKGRLTKIVEVADQRVSTARRHSLSRFHVKTATASMHHRPQLNDYANYRQSPSRAAYPTFLSLHETLWLQTKWCLRGLLDAFRWDLVVRTATRYTSPLVCPCLVVPPTIQRFRNPVQHYQISTSQHAFSHFNLYVRYNTTTTRPRPPKLVSPERRLVLPRPLAPSSRWRVLLSERQCRVPTSSPGGVFVKPT
jgi:hypothetical protein